MPDDTRPLRGRRIALLETREAERLSAMLRQQGADVVSCPAVAIVPAANPAAVRAWLDRFIAQRPDDLILLTGEGLIHLHARAEDSAQKPGFLIALRQTRTITRGPKPARALRELGVEPGLRAAEPTTEGVIALLSAEPMRGRRVGVQLYPEAPPRLPDFLREVGADPDPVTPYDYAANAPDDALSSLIDRIAEGEFDAVAFTSASQVRRLFEVAALAGSTEPLQTGLRAAALAAVGPVVASELEQRGFRPAIVPRDAYFMKPLVTAIVTALGVR